MNGHSGIVTLVVHSSKHVHDYYSSGGAFRLKWSSLHDEVHVRNNCRERTNKSSSSSSLELTGPGPGLEVMVNIIISASNLSSHLHTSCIFNGQGRSKEQPLSIILLLLLLGKETDWVMRGIRFFN